MTKEKKLVDESVKDGFSFNKIADFDKHINNQITSFDILNQIIVTMAQFFIEKGTNVYDLGTSTGRLPRELNKTYKDKIEGVTYYGLEISDNFCNNFVQEAGLSLMKWDLRNEYIFKNTSLITSLFTLQFFDANSRARVIKNVADSVGKNGAFIFVEKTLGENARLEQVMTFSHWNNKADKGFSYEEIAVDEKSLRHQMHLRTPSEIISELKEAGFKEVQIFWSYLQFTGFIAIK